MHVTQVWRGAESARDASVAGGRASVKAVGSLENSFRGRIHTQ